MERDYLELFDRVNIDLALIAAHDNEKLIIENHSETYIFIPDSK